MRPSAIKPMLVAAAMLSVSAGGTELYLRIREEAPGTGGLPGGISTGSALTEPSGTVHHRLPPLSTFASRDPDTGAAVDVVVNSHGLRGGEVAVPKPPGVFRVLCLGDETVLGPELPEPETLPARLQELLQARTRLRVEVLNGGAPGDCPLLAWLRLRDSLLALQPDLVVLHFDMSDVADDQRYRRHTRVDAADVPLACCHPALAARPGAKPWWRDLRLTSVALSLAGVVAPVPEGAEIHDPKAATLWLRDNPPDWGLYVEQSLAPVECLRRAADGTYATLILSTCPQPWQVSAEASDGPGVREAAGVASGAVMSNRAPFDAVARFAAEREILFCDASLAFRDYPDAAKLYFRNSPQLSRFGQELYARLLSEFAFAKLPAFGATDSGGEAVDNEPERTVDLSPPPPEPPAFQEARAWEPVRYQ